MISELRRQPGEKKDIVESAEDMYNMHKELAALLCVLSGGTFKNTQQMKRTLLLFLWSNVRIIELPIAIAPAI